MWPAAISCVALARMDTNPARGWSEGAGQPVGPRLGGGRLSSACVLLTATGQPCAVVLQLCRNHSHLPQTAPVLASRQLSKTQTI